MGPLSGKDTVLYPNPLFAEDFIGCHLIVRFLALLLDAYSAAHMNLINNSSKVVALEKGDQAGAKGLVFLEEQLNSLEISVLAVQLLSALQKDGVLLILGCDLDLQYFLLRDVVLDLEDVRPLGEFEVERVVLLRVLDLGHEPLLGERKRQCCFVQVILVLLLSANIVGNHIETLLAGLTKCLLELDGLRVA